MNRYLLILALIFSTLAPSFAMKRRPSFNGPDEANIQIGPVIVSGNDTDEDPDFITSDPNLFSNSEFIIIDSRPVGFGGTTGAIRISMSKKTQRFLRSKKKGVLRIGGRGRTLSLSLDYQTFGAQPVGTVTSIDHGTSTPKVKGRVKFRRVRNMINLAQSNNDAYEFTINANVRDARVIRATDSGTSGEIVKSLPVKGKFIVTFEKNFFSL